MRRLGPPQRRYSTGPSYPAAASTGRGGDENAPPPDDDGFAAAAPFTVGTKGPAAAAASRRSSFHFSAVRPPLAAASSSRYNRKPQLPPPTPRNGSGVRPAWNAPARRLSAATTSSPAPPPTKRLRKTSSGEILGSKCVPVAPTDQESCSDEGFLSLELEWGIHKTILVEELKSSVEACRQKDAMICTLEYNLCELIQESNGLKKTNVESQELLKERDMEILRLNNELEKARKDQLDHVCSSSAKQEKDHLSSQVEFYVEVIASLATEQVSIKEQLAETELLLDESIEATVQKDVIAQNYASLVMDLKEEIHRLESQLEQSIEATVQMDVIAQNYASLVMDLKEEIHRLESQLEQSIEATVQKDVIAQNYASLVMDLKEEIHRLESQLEQSIEATVQKDIIAQNYASLVVDMKEEIHLLESRLEQSKSEMNKEKEIRKTDAEVKNEIYSLEERVYSLEERVYSLEKKANKFEEAHILRQQSLVMQSLGKAESSLKNEIADLADSVRVPSYRSNELPCSQESQRICRKDVADKESVVPGEDDSDLEILDGPPSNFVTRKKKRPVKVKQRNDTFLRRSKRVAQNAEGLKDAESARKFKEEKEKKPKKPKEPKKPRKPKDTKKGAEGGAEAAEPIPLSMIILCP